MDETIAFVDGDRICTGGACGRHAFPSGFLARYKQNIQTIRERNAWRNEGRGAAFRGEDRREEPADEHALNARINDLAFTCDDHVAYSVSSVDFSGVYLMHLSDPQDAEGHVVHNAKLDFGSLDFSPGRRQLAVAVASGGIDRHIALLDMESGSSRTLTEGDCMDDNPRWGMANPACIYYNSRGVGRDMSGQIRGLGPSGLCCLDLERKEASEVLAAPGHDLIRPAEDREGNLYYIQKPYADPQKSSMSFTDAISIPYKLGRGVFRSLEFFTQRYTGETFNTRGANPAKSKQQDAREVFIHGNLVNVERTLKENTKKGEAFPGIAPQSWQLMRRSPSGQTQVVKRGVLDYDLTANGVVYSNGKFLVRLTNGSEEKLEQRDMVTRLRARV